MGSLKPQAIHSENIVVDNQSGASHHDDANISSFGYDEGDDQDYHVGVRTILAILALSIANCCATFSNTSNTIIKFQVIAVGGAANASWIANSNFLLTLACGPVFGFLSDRLGKKWFIVVGALIGVIGSFISSSAHDIYTIIAGNVLTGIANAGCIVSIAANQEIMPNKLRPYAFGFAQTINSIAAIVGTFSAGAFAKYSSWAWSYRLNGIVYAIAAVSVFATYNPPSTAIRRSGNLRDILSSVDYLGILLFTGSCASLIVGLTWGGTTYTWSSGIIMATLIAGCAGLVLFGLYEWKIKKTDGILDHRLFATLNFPILCLVCLIDGMLLLGVNVLYSQEIGDLFTTDAVRIPTILSPYLITSTAGCLPAGWLMMRTKSYRALLIGALVCCALFTGLMGLLNTSRLHWAYAFTALFGLGTAVTTVIPIVALSLSVPSFLLGTAGTISISFRALGGITGVTIFTAIYNNKYAVNLPAEVGSVLLPAGASESTVQAVLGALASPAPPPVALAAVNGVSPDMIGPLLGAVATASASSWKYVWAAIAALVAANALACCFLQPVADRMNTHVESALEESTARQQQQMGKSSQG